MTTPETLPAIQTHRNCLYHLVSATDSVVIFKPHHALDGVYNVGYRCSPANWASGDLFAL